MRNETQICLMKRPANCEMARTDCESRGRGALGVTFTQCPTRFAFLKSSGRNKKPRQGWIERRCHDHINKRRQVHQRNTGLAIVRRLLTNALRAAALASVGERGWASVGQSL
jgi:hypothetical protein